MSKRGKLPIVGYGGNADPLHEGKLDLPDQLAGGVECAVLNRPDRLGAAMAACLIGEGQKDKTW